ncbi:uncharacterized protein TEOVI_000336700 [Trypanosoma equiperdum]|uniref:Uncharacterized protein n=1 Tax=Trypanosoma equiperdum TaxID=5694 RepID=A0A1G4IH68_TRYEQ|nr:hypothetical protein, conserved [Trypanosoma equiperdum]
MEQRIRLSSGLMVLIITWQAVRGTINTNYKNAVTSGCHELVFIDGLSQEIEFQQAKIRNQIVKLAEEVELLQTAHCSFKGTTRGKQFATLLALIARRLKQARQEEPKAAQLEAAQRILNSREAQIRLLQKLAVTNIAPTLATNVAELTATSGAETTRYEWGIKATVSAATANKCDANMDDSNHMQQAIDGRAQLTHYKGMQIENALPLKLTGNLFTVGSYTSNDGNFESGVCGTSGGPHTRSSNNLLGLLEAKATRTEHLTETGLTYGDANKCVKPQGKQYAVDTRIVTEEKTTAVTCELRQLTVATISGYLDKTVAELAEDSEAGDVASLETTGKTMPPSTSGEKEKTIKGLLQGITGSLQSKLIEPLKQKKMQYQTAEDVKKNKRSSGCQRRKRRSGTGRLLRQTTSDRANKAFSDPRRNGCGKMQTRHRRK